MPFAEKEAEKTLVRFPVHEISNGGNTDAGKITHKKDVFVAFSPVEMLHERVSHKRFLNDEGTARQGAPEVRKNIGVNLPIVSSGAFSDRPGLADFCQFRPRISVDSGSDPRRSHRYAEDIARW